MTLIHKEILTKYSQNSKRNYQMGRSIQEWTKSNFWKTAFETFEGIWS